MVRDDPRYRWATPVDGYAGILALVLGGGGFLGRWITESLLRSGAQTHVTVRTPTDETSPAISHHLEISEAGAVRSLLEEVRPTIVFNAIGYGVDPEEKRAPDEAAAAWLNRELPRVLAESLAGIPASAPWRGRRLVHVGSVLEYGPIGGRLAETSVERPVGWYAQTKCAGTIALLEVAPRLGLDAVTARVPQLYGPGEHSGRLVPILAQTARSGRPLVLSQGTQFKDFLFVAEAAEGLLRLGLTQGPQGERVNLATGQLTAVREFVTIAARVLQIPNRLIRFEHPVPDGELAHDPIAIDRLRRLTGWAPTTPPAIGLERTLAAG